MREKDEGATNWAQYMKTYRTQYGSQSQAVYAPTEQELSQKCVNISPAAALARRRRCSTRAAQACRLARRRSLPP
jgi:hypothetical protein